MPTPQPAHPSGRWLGLGAVVCVAAAVVGSLRFNSSLYFFDDVKGKPGAFQGAMTAVSGFLLVAAAVLLLQTASALGREHGGRSFAGFAWLLIALAFDEVVMVHEWATEKMEALGCPKMLGIDADLWIFLGYGAVAACCGLGMLAVMARAREARPWLLWMVALAGASQAVDFVPWNSLSRTQQQWLGPLEEGLKTLATMAAVFYAHSLLQAVRRSPTGAPVAPPPQPNQ